MRLLKKGFTLIELLVVISIIALLLSIIMPALKKVKEKAKTTICLNNNKQLSVAWMMYAGDNDSKLVSANLWTPSAYDEATMTLKPIKQQMDELEDGMLFSYVGNSKQIFRCPSQRKEVARSYNISHAMGPTGNYTTGYWASTPFVTKLSNIRSPGDRIVFVDEYTVSWGPWSQWYDKEAWWNQPPVQHSEVATFSFADGHSDYWKWSEDRTIELGKMEFKDYMGLLGTNYEVPAPDSKDLRKTHRAVWGKLGY